MLRYTVTIQRDKPAEFGYERISGDYSKINKKRLLRDLSGGKELRNFVQECENSGARLISKASLEGISIIFHVREYDEGEEEEDTMPRFSD